MATTRGERLRIARAKLFKSARAAAGALGLPPATYGAHERAESPGGRDFGPDEAKRYGRRFRVTPEWLLTGSTGSTPESSEPQRIPLLSWVSAGGLVDASSQIPVEDVPLLAFADLGRGDFFALRVTGDSMDRLSPDGSVIVVDRLDRTLVTDKPYVFTRRGETTYKLWQPEPPHLAPFSTNPVHRPIFLKRKNEYEVIGRVKRSVLDL